jgi:hypothetical protein
LDVALCFELHHFALEPRDLGLFGLLLPMARKSLLRIRETVICDFSGGMVTCPIVNFAATANNAAIECRCRDLTILRSRPIRG